jgi:NTE family protein
LEVIKINRIFAQKKMTEPNKKYKLGLALSGGGTRGFAHVGVMQVLEEYGLRPDVIVGTSAGALMGALFADGYSSAEIKLLFTGREFSEFVSLQIPRMGLFDGSRFRQFVRRVIRADNIEELLIPTIVMTTDFDRGKAHAFTKGSVAETVTASCSIPILFNPVRIDGVHYVDGGLFHNFPVSIIRDECDIVIGSNVSPIVPDKYNKTLVGVAERSYHYLFRSNTYKDREICDILVETDEFGLFKMFDLKNVNLLAQIGYRAAERALAKYAGNRPADAPATGIAVKK